jgi:hypothetical protein
MEHIPNLPEVLRMLHRLLKPGGEIHTTVDALANVDDKALIKKHRIMFKVQDYLRPETVESIFGTGGFRVLEQRYILRGPLALDELTREIETGEGSWPESRRRAGAEEMRREEARFKDTDPGLMILCRLEKI